MAFSTTGSPGVSRDPYELDRLAEELEDRESALFQESHAELPLYIPLSHENKYLSAKQFDVEEFLLSRSHTSLPDLRTELRDYLSTLKEELVQLINDDYEAFISLSTDLKDEGVRLNRLRYPLGGLKNRVLESKKELEIIQDAIQAKLKKRAVLREQEALLHLLLKISESVVRIESLLLISPPDKDDIASSGLEGSKLVYNINAADDSMEDKGLGNRAKHLGRVAAEYTQLLYHASKAQAENCVFVSEIQWRIDRIRSTLSSDLDHVFATTLSSLVEPKQEEKITEIDRAKFIADLTECLRTYDLLGLWRDAEDVLRRDVVRNFVKKVIHSGALAAPHSPVIPRTPFQAVGGQDLMPLRTPYTPFTAFISRNTVHQSVSNSNPPRVQLLEDIDDPLVNLYNQILRFVERDLCRIMDIAERVSVRGSVVKKTEKTALVSPMRLDWEKEADLRGFEIMANVVWEELSRAIVDQIGSIIFAAGQPADFRKNYETTQAFIRSLEILAPSKKSVESLRSHPSYKAFQRHWQLPVYFQLRWKEIIGKLEDSLSVTRVEPTFPKDKNTFATIQASSVWIAISACWSAEVFISDLSHRFWKLTLQILSRYKTWLLTSFTDFEKSLNTSPGSAAVSSTSTQPNTEAISAEAVAADDATLKQYVAAIIDIGVMQTNVTNIWHQQISMILPGSSEAVDADLLIAEDALQQALSNLTSQIPSMSSQITAILSRRCCDTLRAVRNIPLQFRSTSNKRQPSEPSSFVPSILRPLKFFFGIETTEGPGYILKDSLLDSYATEVVTNVSQRYIHHLVTMKKMEESLKRLNKTKKSTFSLFSSTATKDDEGKDGDRIRTQMILDVEAFEKDAKSLGVNTDSNEAYKSLKQMVYAVDED